MLVITVHPTTLVYVNDTTLLLNRGLIFLIHQEVFDGGRSFKVSLHSMFAANNLQILTQPSVVWNYYVWILVVVSARVCFVASILILGWVPWLDFYSIESPCRVFAFCECSV